jgi:hypothetical protein
MTLHLQLFCHSGLWIITGAHMLDGYFRLQKTDTAISCVISSLVMLKNIHKLMQLITFGTALIDTLTFYFYTKFHIPDISGSSIITINTKTKCRFWVATMLNYISLKTTLLLKVHYHTVFQDPTISGARAGSIPQIRMATMLVLLMVIRLVLC